jgi:hypothetical protein
VGQAIQLLVVVSAARPRKRPSAGRHRPRPRLALIAAIIVPNLWLTIIGHTETNYLFLALLVAVLRRESARTFVGAR